MAWRIHDTLAIGLLNNTQPGRVTGRLGLLGMSSPVNVELVGDFHRDIRGAMLVLRPDWPTMRHQDAAKFLEAFSLHQVGEVGDITAGQEPVDYVAYPYIEWYSKDNGRVIIELQPHEVEVVGTPLPPEAQQPLSRDELDGRLRGHVQSMVEDLDVVGMVAGVKDES